MPPTVPTAPTAALAPFAGADSTLPKPNLLVVWGASSPVSASASTSTAGAAAKTAATLPFAISTTDNACSSATSTTSAVCLRLKGDVITPPTILAPLMGTEATLPPTAQAALAPFTVTPPTAPAAPLTPLTGAARLPRPNLRFVETSSSATASTTSSFSVFPHL